MFADSSHQAEAGAQHHLTTREADVVLALYSSLALEAGVRWRGVDGRWWGYGTPFMTSDPLVPPEATQHQILALILSSTI